MCIICICYVSGVFNAVRDTDDNDVAVQRNRDELTKEISLGNRLFFLTESKNRCPV